MKRKICLLLLFLFLSAGIPAESEESSGAADFPPSGGSPAGLNSLTEEQFSADDLPEEYTRECSESGRVEKVRYSVPTEDGSQVRAAMVYLPFGYDTSEDRYNILYLFHASGGTPQNYLNPEKETVFKNLLDHMIADQLLNPLIVVAATYYPTEDFLRFMPLGVQVSELSGFPEELVATVLPAVEGKYRTWADSTDPEGIASSRDHRAVAGFSLGGVITWEIFQKEMKAFRWFLPISEASWADAEGGTSGIWDSDISAQVLHDAVLEQGFGRDDFRLFVATGTEDEAFDVATSQMVSLLEYSDLFQPGENTSCSMMIGGTHTISAVYTYLYHILPALWRGETSP